MECYRKVDDPLVSISHQEGVRPSRLTALRILACYWTRASLGLAMIWQGWPEQQILGRTRPRAIKRRIFPMPTSPEAERSREVPTTPTNQRSTENPHHDLRRPDLTPDAP